MQELENNKGSDNSIIIFKRVSDTDKFNFFEYLSVMVNSGVSMGEALSSVMDKISSPYFRQRIEQLMVFFSSGDSLSKAMKKDPSTFTQYEISIIESGESTGTLDKSLANLANNVRKTYDLKKKIKGAITYPIIIFIFLFLAVLIVLTYVIPSIMPLFESFESELPVATKALVAVSDFVSTNFALIILFIFTVFVIAVGYKSTESGEEKLDNMLLNLPIFGVVYKNYILSNIASNMGNLVGAGVSTMKMLHLVGNSSGSLVYKKIFILISRRVESGEKIVDSMKAVDEDRFYFPASFLQMLHVGEKTASIEDISKKMYKHYTREVDYSLSNMTKWIEPIAILLAALFVVWFAFAIFGAILKVTTIVN